MNGKKQNEKDKDQDKSVAEFGYKTWDPLKMNLDPGMHYQAVYRFKKDLHRLMSDLPPGVFAIPDMQDMMMIHAIIVGPMETPYEGGFFYFIIGCPERYPMEPPLVKLMTTDAGRVRFNPNLYRNGKVCLSILGTWSGPAWSPAQQISSVLISIQSLMNEKPYFNEPGMRTERYPGEAMHYNDIITHETLRVAVCGMLENECSLNLPQSFQNILKENFLTFYDQYISTAENKVHLDGETMKDPYGDIVGTFGFKKILERLKNIKVKILENRTEADGASSSNAEETNDEDEPQHS